MTAQWQNPKDIHKRIIISGKLRTITPAHLGCGDSDSVLDMPLLRDPLEDRALLTGATLAGGLRSYLVKNGKDKEARKLFGGVNDDTSFESPLIVDDSIGDALQVEIRNGVAINPETRTAKEKQKYDYEMMPSGMTFPIAFELIISKKDQDKEILKTLAFALKGLQNGEIFLGKRKRRGFGECQVSDWKYWSFDWNSTGMLEWLNFNPLITEPQSSGDSIEEVLSVNLDEVQNSSTRCRIEATFSLLSSFLIRSSSISPGLKNVDSVYMKDDHGNPIITGTSLAGVFRGRVQRIANTLGRDGEQVAAQMFGDGGYVDSTGVNHRAKASRFWVKEAVIEENSHQDYIQTRVGIDRFTGGASEARLFSEIPVWSTPRTNVTLTFGMENPEPIEVGYMFLLLKDLWAGDLPIGGESSIGRGRFMGKCATIEFGTDQWRLESEDEASIRIISGDSAKFDELLKMVFANGGENE